LFSVHLARVVFARSTTRCTHRIERVNEDTLSARGHAARERDLL